MTEWNTARAAAFLYRQAAELLEHTGLEGDAEARVLAWHAHHFGVSSERAFRSTLAQVLSLTDHAIDVAVLGVQEVRDDR